jgi:urease accessory protein
LTDGTQVLRAQSVRAAGSWQDAADTVVLDFDDRHRRRVVMTGVKGLFFLLDLPQAIALRSGDALALDDGRLVEVLAAPESLLEIKAETLKQLARIAWHLGNRHLPTQILGTKLRIRYDHVIEDMLRGMGASVVSIDAPFDPEGGAYSGHADHSHDHADHHHDDHHHGHGDDHRHAHHDR